MLSEFGVNLNGHFDEFFSPKGATHVRETAEGPSTSGLGEDPSRNPDRKEIGKAREPSS